MDEDALSWWTVPAGWASADAAATSTLPATIVALVISFSFIRLNTRIYAVYRLDPQVFRLRDPTGLDTQLSNGISWTLTAAFYAEVLGARHSSAQRNYCQHRTDATSLDLSLRAPASSHSYAGTRAISHQLAIIPVDT